MKLYPILVILIFGLVSCKHPKPTAPNAETANHTNVVSKPEEVREPSKSQSQKEQKIEKPQGKIAKTAEEKTVDEKSLALNKKPDEQVVVMDRKKMTEYLITI